MAERALFHVADGPLEAYLVTRDRRLPGDEPEVMLYGHRGAVRGTDVQVRVPEERLRPVGKGDQFVVPRAVLTPGSFGRAFQPWHVDVQPDEERRWKGYLDPVYDLTLLNLVGAQTPMELERKEAGLVEARLLELRTDPVGQTFDLAHLRALHRRLFRDVYPWAGETRTVSMAKGATEFLGWERIEESGAVIAEHLREHGLFVGAGRGEFIEGVAQLYDAVNGMHPFREGNGRTQRLFLQDVARAAGYRIDWTQVTGKVNDVVSTCARDGDLDPMRQMLTVIVSERPEPRAGNVGLTGFSPPRATAPGQATETTRYQPRPNRYRERGGQER